MSTFNPSAKQYERTLKTMQLLFGTEAPADLDTMLLFRRETRGIYAATCASVFNDDLGGDDVNDVVGEVFSLMRAAMDTRRRFRRAGVMLVFFNALEIELRALDEVLNAQRERDGEIEGER